MFDEGAAADLFVSAINKGVTPEWRRFAWMCGVRTMPALYTWFVIQ